MMSTRHHAQQVLWPRVQAPPVHPATRVWKNDRDDTLPRLWPQLLGKLFLSRLSLSSSGCDALDMPSKLPASEQTLGGPRRAPLTPALPRGTPVSCLPAGVAWGDAGRKPVQILG